MQIAVALLVCLTVVPTTLAAQAGAADGSSAPAGAPVSQQAAPQPVTCASTPGQRTQCPADTSRGVVLRRSMGEAPCLLGRTWGYDQTSVWVSDGCSAEFVTGAVAEATPTKPKAPSHIPNVGFLLVDD